MNEIYKSFLSIILFFTFWSGVCFGLGYLFHNTRATKQLDEANQQLAEQQLKYDKLVRESETRIRESEKRIAEANERISNIREELFGKISDNGQTITELSTIIESIKKQRINL